MPLSADKLYGDAHFLFPVGLSADGAKTMSNWSADRGVAVLDWPANTPDLNPTENLLGL